MQIAMIQDKIISLDQLDPSYLDRASFFGDGVYEVIRSYNGKVFALDDHMQRFSNSLNAKGITTVDIGQIRGRVMQAFEAAEIANAKIYFHITRGCAQRKHSFDENMQPNFFLTSMNWRMRLRSKPMVSRYRSTRIGDGNDAISNR